MSIGVNVATIEYVYVVYQTKACFIGERKHSMHQSRSHKM